MHPEMAILANKVGYLISIPPHAEFGRDDHREDSPRFIFQNSFAYAYSYSVDIKNTNEKNEAIS